MRISLLLDQLPHQGVAPDYIARILAAFPQLAADDLEGKPRSQGTQ
jgi:hypothetical protein